MKTPFCVKLNQGEGNVTKKCWIRVPAIQPLLKRDLEDFCGRIPDDKLELVHRRLVQYMGLA